jgi:Protein of unknown function (DUF4239)
LDWIFEIPTASLAVLFAVIFVGATWVGIIFVKPFLRLFLRRQVGLNDLVGYVLAGHCAFFGLLLSLLAVAAYQNLNDVDRVVNREAGFLRSIYRAVTDYPEPLRSETLPLIREYTRYVVEDAWPQQRRGIAAPGGTERMNAVQAKLFAFEPKTRAQEIIHMQTMTQFFEMAEVRRARIQAIDAGVPAIMWYVVVIGLAITLGLVWMLDMRMLPHMLLGGLLMLFLSTVICLIVVMDKPLRGEFGIGPNAYTAVLDRMTSPVASPTAGSIRPASKEN